MLRSLTGFQGRQRRPDDTSSAGQILQIRHDLSDKSALAQPLNWHGLRGP